MISAEQTHTFQTVVQLSEGEMAAIDGKPMPRSYDAGQGQGAIHRVSIGPVSQNRMMPGQVKVKGKSSAITAIAKRLKTLASG